MNNNFKYDFLIVGAGFAGASCARLLSDKGYKCLIIEERPFVSGNCVTDKQMDIDIHFFGAHILHTNNEGVWSFLKSYGDIIEYTYKVNAWNNGKIYPMPFGMEMLNSIYNKAWPYECRNSLNIDLSNEKSKNSIESYCLANFGKQIYEKIYKNIYEKKFNLSCKDIPVACLEEFIENTDNILIYNRSFYPDKYQGIPEEGYVKLVENIIGDDIDILLNKNFLENKEAYMRLAKYVIYTGELDKFFDYSMGELHWKSFQFEFRNESKNASNLSGNAITYFSDNETGWFRMTEHKWLTPWRNSEDFNKNTFVTYELAKEWQKGEETYYPFPDEYSINLNNRYIEKLKIKYPNTVICGGKPNYRFMTICETIENAFELVEKITTNK